MKKKAAEKIAPAKKESKKDLNKETTESKSAKKGYNEKNPGQSQGAFKPDNSSTGN